MQTLRFSSAKPQIKMDLVVEPAAGSLCVKLVDAGTVHTNLFVRATPGWLIKKLSEDLKHTRGDPVHIAITWTDTENGFTFYLTRKDIESLLAKLKEHGHV